MGQPLKMQARMRKPTLAIVMERLHPDVVSCLPLDRASLAALSCVSRGMRDLVACVRCNRGMAISEARVHMLNHPRYATMTALSIVGPCQPHTSSPSPIPVPRPMPFLHTLRLHHCRPRTTDFWEVVVRRAPMLSRIAVHPVFSCANYADVLHTCAAMLRALARLEMLTSLEVSGQGTAMWGRGWHSPHTVMGQAFAVSRAIAGMDSIAFRHLRELTLTGQQFLPAVDAPLHEATIEEPTCPDVRAVDRLGPRARCLRHLTWHVPVHHLPLPPCFARLERLDVRINDIRSESAFDRSLRAMSGLPASLVHLAVSWDFESLCGEDPLLAYTPAHLGHLVLLEAMDLCVSFPTRECGALVRGLLGAPASVKSASICALGGPADRLKRVLEVMCEDGADPESDDVTDVEDEIALLEHGARLHPVDIEHALAEFPKTHFALRGFPTDFARAHPRMSIYQ